MHLGGHEGEERKGDNLRSPILEDGLEVIPGRGVEVSRETQEPREGLPHTAERSGVRAARRGCLRGSASPVGVQQVGQKGRGSRLRPSGTAACTEHVCSRGKAEEGTPGSWVWS